MPFTAKIREKLNALFATSATPQDFLRRDLTKLDELIARIHDPDRGAVGADFLRGFAATGCAETIDQSLALPAGYMPDANTITYGRERWRLAVDRFHEVNHAMQWRAAPALRADPADPGAATVLSPRAFVMALLLTERDTAAKQAWLCADAAKNDSAIKQAAARCNVPAAAFAAARKQAGLPAALARMAEDTLDKTTCYAGTPGNERQMTLTEFYCDRYLSHYEAAIAAAGDGNFSIARLGDNDIRAIGGAFGPNSFTDARGNVLPAFQKLPPLSPALEARIDRLNRRLGIADEASLSFFQETNTTAKAAAMPAAPS